MPTNQYGVTEFDADPETAAELIRLKRQQQIADAMMQRGQQPIQGQMVGGVYVAPSITQGLAQLFNAYSGRRGADAAEQGYKDLAGKRRAVEDAAIERYKRGTIGAPEQPMGPPTPSGETGVRPAFAPSPEQRNQAIIDAVASSNPRLARMAQMQFQMDSKKEDRATSREDRLLQLEMQHQNNLAAIKEKALEGRITREEADRRAAESKEQMIRLAASMRPQREEAAPVAVIGPDGKPVLVSRRDAVGKTPAAMDAATQGAITGAKQEGEAKAKRALNMAGLGETIDTAKALLSGTSGKALPTGSGIGTLYDAAAGMVGASPEGAAESQTMKAIGGALTSKMPRMEGPQSDKDTQLYKEMAAVVGDSTVPRERRLAALSEVERLWGKYEPGTSQKSSPPGGFSDAEKERRYQEWKAKQK